MVELEQRQYYFAKKIAKEVVREVEAPSLRFQVLWSVVGCRKPVVLKTGDRSRSPRVGSR